LNLLKHEHAPQETSLQKDVLDAEEEAQKIRASSKSKAELSTVFTQLDQLEQQISEIVEIYTAREQKKLECAKIQEEVKALAGEKQELEAKVASARAKRDGANKALADAQTLEASTCDVKQANDMLEVSRVVPGRTERVELAEEKEKLARIIGTLHESMTMEESRFKAEKKENSAILDCLQEELTTVKEEREGKKSKLDHFIRIRDESKENWEREIKEHESLEHKYQLANDAERARAEDIRKARKKGCDERLEIAKSKASERERYLQVLVYGAELLDNTRDAERKLLEDPVDI
jgi:phage FluMu protein gp41